MLKLSYWIRLIACWLCFSIVTPAAHAQSDTEWAALKEQVQERASKLDAIIDLAERKSISTDYASVSRHVISTYLIAAQHDKDHVEDVRKIFQQTWWFKKTDPQEADNLPWNELNSCLEVADHAIAALNQQLDGTLTFVAPPDMFQGKMTLGSGGYRLDGTPVFPHSLVWLPKTKEYTEAFGNIGGVFYQLTNLNENGTLAPFALKNSVQSTHEQVKNNAAPLVLLLGHAPAKWLTDKYPEIKQGERNFTKYDIDNPLVRATIEQLCSQFLPRISQAAKGQPQVHLMANEPHFATKTGGWLANNGVSDLTMQKYRGWIAARYKTVEEVNQSQGTSFANLDDVTVQLPIDSKLRGSAIWYDWCRFNMDRVNNWFTFLKKATQGNDPEKSPVSIKLISHSFTGTDRDAGMDWEYLIKLQEVPGYDLRVVPRGATYYAKNEDGGDTETGWASRYAYLWVDQSIILDFTKSLCPDRLIYDSEWHGFGTVSWRHYHLDRDYVRSALWLAFSHGMGMINPWLWGRGLDGSLSDKANHIGELATQPTAVDAYGRVMKELNAHAEEVVAAVPSKREVVLFYSEESAIQSESYMVHLKDVYESLKLLNVNVGFVTPSDMSKLDSDTQSLVIAPTPFVSDESLAAVSGFQNAGGQIVLIDAEKSFTNTERGNQRQGSAPIIGTATLSLKPVLQMADELEPIFETLRSKMPLNFEITDRNGSKAYGVFITQSIHPTTGIVSVVLNNVSKDDRVVNLRPSTAKSGVLADSITRQRVSGVLQLKPCDVRVLKAALK